MSANTFKPRFIFSQDETAKEEIVLKKDAKINIILHPVGQEAPVHSHEETHLIFVRAGKMQFNLNGEVKDVSPGDMIVIPPKIPHNFKVLGQQPCKTICVSVSS